MTRRILITGGLGYLGGRIAAHLLEAMPGTEIAVTTRSPHRALPAALAGASELALDLEADEIPESVCCGVTDIVHLAAANEILSGQEPLRALDVTTGGTLRLLQASGAAGVKRFIYFSTAHVYRSPLVGLIDETVLPQPRHPYAITHRAAEDFVAAAAAKSDMTGVVVRLSNGFGYPTHPEVDRWSLLVTDLCRQAVTTGTLTLKSSGTQERDFICLSDVARATKHLLDIPLSELPDDCTFNLGGGNTMTVLQMAELIQERCRDTLGFEPPIHRPSGNPGEAAAERLLYDCSRLNATGFALEGNPAAEIDGLLRLCHEAFGRA